MLTRNEIITLIALRGSIENMDGEWGAVYLDNAKPAKMNGHAFAATLGSLEKKGLYRPENDPKYKGIFGNVKI